MNLIFDINDFAIIPILAFSGLVFAVWLHRILKTSCTLIAFVSAILCFISDVTLHLNTIKWITITNDEHAVLYFSWHFILFVNLPVWYFIYTDINRRINLHIHKST